MSIAVVSGGFDPIHSGHVRMIREAAMYGETLVVLVNTDEWMLRKKGYVSMCLNERMEIIRSIRDVTMVLPAHDEDGTVCESLRLLSLINPGAHIVFCNGGDRGPDDSPEKSLVNDIGGVSVFGVGGTEKINSSSRIWPKHSLGKVDRLWGSYYDHFRNENCVFKTMEFDAGKSTSLQRHLGRDEFWFVERGNAVVGINELTLPLDAGGWVRVPRETWHIITAGDEGATIREMQIGVCSEDDIERM